MVLFAACFVLCIWVRTCTWRQHWHVGLQGATFADNANFQVKGLPADMLTLHPPDSAMAHQLIGSSIRSMSVDRVYPCTIWIQHPVCICIAGCFDMLARPVGVRVTLAGWCACGSLTSGENAAREIAMH